MTDIIISNELRHSRHLEWLRQLDFIQDQIKIFQNELMRVLHQHPDFMSAIEHVDEYRAILLRKLHRVDEFRSLITLHERLLGSTDPPPDFPEIQDHDVLEEQIHLFLADFDDLKNTLRRFVSRND